MDHPSVKEFKDQGLGPLVDRGADDAFGLQEGGTLEDDALLYEGNEAEVDEFSDEEHLAHAPPQADVAQLRKLLDAAEKRCACVLFFTNKCYRKIFAMLRAYLLFLAFSPPKHGRNEAEVDQFSEARCSTVHSC